MWFHGYILTEIANRATVMRICNPIGRLLSQQTWCYHKVLTRGRSLEHGGHDDMLQGYLNHCKTKSCRERRLRELLSRDHALRINVANTNPTYLTTIGLPQGIADWRTFLLNQGKNITLFVW